MDPADVVPLDDLTPSDWVRAQLVELDGRVRNVVPAARYDAVARVLHPAHSASGLTVRWAEVAGHCECAGTAEGGLMHARPYDRSWCVASEIDFDSTLVAGSEALVAELVASPDLEAFEVDRDDSLQFDADRVNVRRRDTAR